jgi:hypothetical protein
MPIEKVRLGCVKIAVVSTECWWRNWCETTGLSRLEKKAADAKHSLLSLARDSLSTGVE